MLLSRTSLSSPSCPPQPLARSGHGGHTFEPLERRTLFAGTPLWVTQAAGATGPELWIDGSPGDDRISVVAYGQSLTLANKGGWSTTLPNHFAVIRINGARGNDLVIVDGSVTTDAVVRGSNGDDTIMSGAGNDRLYGGFGRDRILGGAGDDTIVTIGDSIQERVSGDDGFDSFWTDVHRSEVITDASPEEAEAGAVHRVGALVSAPAADGDADALNPTIGSRDLAGQDLPDPIAAGRYASYEQHPLFSQAGPLQTDIRQGAVGDCYLLASLSAVASQDANVIRQAIVELGDGTYGVRYYRDGQPVYLRVDADLPSYGSTQSPVPMYADQGAGGSLWVALMEKAYALFRTGAGTYASLSTGWMTEALGAVGLAPDTIWHHTRLTITELLTHVKAELDAGAAVTVGTWEVPQDVPLVSLHAYAIDSVALDSDGTPIAVTLHNPWGTDGGTIVRSDGTNDGRLTITPDELSRSFSAIMFARV